MKFFLCVLLFLVGAFVLSQGFKNPIEWIKENKGAWKGIKIVMIIVFLWGLLSMVTGCSTASMVAGLDHHYDGISPQCDRNSSDSHTTSNIAFRVYERVDSMTLFATQFQHHSCAFGGDSKEYNAVGFYFERLLWAM